MTSVLQRRMEKRMVDQCRITSDPEGAGDDVLDQATGELVPPASDTSTVYEGPCVVYLRPRAERTDEQGGATMTVQDYIGAIPLAETAPRIGDTFTVTDTRDPRFVNRSFRIVEVLGGTYAVTRDLRLQEWSR